MVYFQNDPLTRSFFTPNSLFPYLQLRYHLLFLYPSLHTFLPPLPPPPLLVPFLPTKLSTQVQAGRCFNIVTFMCYLCKLSVIKQNCNSVCSCVFFVCVLKWLSVPTDSSDLVAPAVLVWLLKGKGNGKLTHRSRVDKSYRKGWSNWNEKKQIL